MKLIERPAGCTISAVITLDRNLSEFDEIYLYLFTSISNPIKFFYGVKKGWLEATALSENQLQIVAPATMTKKLSGELLFSIAPHSENTIEQIGRAKKSMGIDVKQDYPLQDL